MTKSVQERWPTSSRTPGRYLAAALLAYLVCSFFVSPEPCRAATFVRVADGDLVTQAEAVVEGRVLSVDPTVGESRAETEYQVRVDEVVAGTDTGSTIRLRVPGGHLPDGSRVHVFGAPRFEVGERVLLFVGSKSAGTDRIHHVLHLAQGAFRVVETGDRVLAVQDLSESAEVEMPGRKLERTGGPRDLALFRTWLRDRVRGKVRTADYFVDLPDAEKFGLVRSLTDGMPVRWQDFDTSGSVPFRVHQDGQPGLDGGGFAQFQSALQVWQENPVVAVQPFFIGSTTSTVGGLRSDGINALLFDDPNDHFNTLFSCSGGGTVAATWVRYSSTRHTWNGVDWWTIFETDIVTNRGIECWISVGDRAEEVFGHEIGHTLGLSHSCGDARNGPCDLEILDEALMRAVPHADGRGASLGQDDLDALEAIYGVEDSPPAPPSGLAAEIIRGGAVELRWSDGSDNELGFDVERKLAGVGAEFEPLGRSNGNSPRYVDIDVSSGVAYTYRVRAYNGLGISAYSNEATAIAGGELAPTELLATPLSSNAIELTWRDNATGEDGYLIEGWDDRGDSFLAARPSNLELVTIRGLRAATTYTFRVKALGGAGDSSFSNEASATTFPVDVGDCEEGPATLCLLGARFQVEIEWRDFDAREGVGSVVPLGSSRPAGSGLFWFFAPDNWELLVKVLDGCGFNGRYWVFAAATTNVEYTLRVTDTLRGVEWSYTNPLGNASAAVTDTEALATCP